MKINIMHVISTKYMLGRCCWQVSLGLDGRFLFCRDCYISVMNLQIHFCVVGRVLMTESAIGRKLRKCIENRATKANRIVILCPEIDKDVSIYL